MSDPIDDSGGETQVRQKRSLARDDLNRALASHRRWIEGLGSEEDRANLSRANLRAVDLSGLNLGGIELCGSVLDRANCEKTILFGAKLQSASLRLCNLSSADLQGADFSGANLNGANLRDAYAFNALFCRAHLNDADLQDANLTRSNFADAWLVGAKLERAVLANASLRGADLREATLMGCRLQAADLRGATLRGANFDADGASSPSPTAFARADLTGADLRSADLSDAKLQTVTGLLAGALAGANLSNAALPSDIARFPALEQVAEVSKHARTLFIAMITACVYSWLTIATTTDLALVTNSSSSPLPIIQTPVPVAGFFWAGPLILLGLFFYFHLYLQGMWDALAGLPAVFPAGRTLDAQAYPWLLTSLVRAHVPLLIKDRPVFSKLKVLFSIIAGWWLVPVTLGLYWLRYLPRQDWYGTAFILGTLVAAVAGAGLFYDRACTTLRGPEMPKSPGLLAHWLAPAVVTLMCCGALLAWISEATSRRHVDWGIFRAYAELSGAELSRKPPNWNILKGDLEIARQLSPNRVERILLDGVTPASLRGARLTLANLRDAFLPKANLQGARLRWADLTRTDLRGANLCQADLRGADLKDARLDGANLSHARVDSVKNLEPAQLAKACAGGGIRLPANLPQVSLTSCVGNKDPCPDG